MGPWPSWNPEATRTRAEPSKVARDFIPTDTDPSNKAVRMVLAPPELEGEPTVEEGATKRQSLVNVGLPEPQNKN